MLAALHFENEVLSDAVESNLCYVWTLPLAAQDRAITLMESHRLHTWLTDTQASALFVNGNHDPSARQSPISYVCSKLMESLCNHTADLHPKCSSLLAQGFFCGQQINLDPAGGPSGMMRSLLSQLIINYSGSDMLNIRQLFSIDLFDMVELCKLFSKLIGSLPRRSMVLCVIDGITLYEGSPKQCKAAVEATKSLLEIMESCKKTGCIFKLLMTSPGNSRAVCQEFDDEEVIWMPKKVNPRGGLRSARWGAGAKMYAM